MLSIEGEYRMYIYIFIMLTVFILNLNINQHNTYQNKKIKKIVIFVMITLVIIAAFRADNVGTDTYSYRHYTSRLVNLSMNDIKLNSKSPFFYIILKFFSNIVPEKYLYSGVISAFTALFIGIFIYRNSKNPLLSCYLYITLLFYCHSLNVARQMLAVSLIALCINLVMNKKKKAALVFWIMAVSIHITTIVFLPFLFIGSLKKITWKIESLIVMGSIVFFSLYDVVLDLIVKYFPKYQFYIVDNWIFETGNNKKIILTIFYLGIIIAGKIVFNKIIKNSKIGENDIFRWRYLLILAEITVLLGFVALKSLLLTRFEYYFSISFILLIPLVIEKYRPKFMIKIIIMILTAIPFIISLVKGIDGIVPYKIM